MTHKQGDSLCAGGKYCKTLYYQMYAELIFFKYLIPNT